MATTSALITADDLLRLPDDGTRRELVRGEILSFPLSGAQHGLITMNISYPLAQHVYEHHLGDVLAAGTGYILATNPDTVRAPDVSFVHKDRTAFFDDEWGYGPEAPDLAIEVISPDDLYMDVEDKVSDYLNAGTGMVLVVNPRNRTVRIHRALGSISTLTEHDTIDGENIVPSWTCPVRSIFE